MRSYYWSKSFDGINTLGDGTLNWKGTTDSCNTKGDMGGGINCYGQCQPWPAEALALRHYRDTRALAAERRQQTLAGGRAAA